MTTSGTRAFDLDIAEIIEEAYERCGLEVRTGYDARTARRSLNIMLADWANRGLNLWTVKQGTLPLVAGQASYTLTSDVIDLLEVVLRRGSTDYEVTRMSRGEYMTLPSKTTQGQPSQFFLLRNIDPVLTLWAVPENSTDQLVYYYVQRLQDAGSLQNTGDTPARFLPALVSGLAFHLAVKRSPERAPALKQLYEEDFQRAADEDIDRVSFRIYPDYRRGG